ncbi:hypothetical protein LLT5_07630 [Lactococcus cremoris subsp. cremoris TIFN5]|nr:phage-encoded protein [Lactococcus cremoris]EQC56556.1 hypothetical protein LLT5_07630 [Lactococcus cremoris subsp. cremoris TIFN5]EQC83889.1 hypothetical protein LLT1_03610 [Lactococcus cremoris subsp. cremoris TIFN1]QGJ84447.1 hypothetical protein [Lactococcus phage proPhi1]QGJ84607.1 hypothetical protein [Lactococcus phage proPhi5]
MTDKLISLVNERGSGMTTEEIVQNYQVKLLKIIFKEIDSLMKKKEKADINASKLAKTSNTVNTSEYWKSVGNAEFYIKEIYQKLSALAEIDRLFHWSDRLHQEQLKFVGKYPNVMEKYRQTNIAGQ